MKARDISNKENLSSYQERRNKPIDLTAPGVKYNTTRRGGCGCGKKR
ncbi:hypothetical protein [Halalkalibacillus halophilus]|nr:hypothetical protein [Halalkalibacillus halophilus]